MDAWVGTDERHRDITVYHRQYEKLDQRRTEITNVFHKLQANGIVQSEPVHKVFASELDELVKHEPYGEFGFGMSLDAINFAHASQVVYEHAPSWYTLLWTLCGNRRIQVDRYNDTTRARLNRLIFSFTGIVCFARQKKTSSTFASCMDLYLQGSAVHRRVIETLSGLGICHSYKTGLATMRELASHSKVCPVLLHTVRPIMLVESI